MARKALTVKAHKTPKFQARTQNRCEKCGRARGYIRRFRLCRICFREMANNGKIPGVTKASW